MDREALGRLVRAIWVEWAAEQAKDYQEAHPHHLWPWENMSEDLKEVDRRIGERLYWMGRLDVRAEEKRLHSIEQPLQKIIDEQARRIGEYSADRDTLAARVASLEAALRFVEWEGSNYRHGEWESACPACEQAKTDGHAADCPIRLALAAPAPGATGEEGADAHLS